MKLRLAVEIVKAAFRKKAISLKDAADKIREKAEEIMERPEIVKRAEANVKACAALERDLSESLGA